MKTSRIVIITIAILLAIIVITSIFIFPTLIPLTIKETMSGISQSLPGLEREKPVITPLKTPVPTPIKTVSTPTETPAPPPPTIDPCDGTLYITTLWIHNKTKTYSQTKTISHNLCVPKETTSVMPEDGTNWTAVFVEHTNPDDPENSRFIVYPRGMSLYEEVMKTYKPAPGTPDITITKSAYPSRDILYPILNSVCNDGHGYCTAQFGYVNMADSPVFIPVGPDNYFTPSPDFQGQPIEFLVGFHPEVFSVTFPAWSTSRMWWLNTKTAVAIPPDRMGAAITCSLPDGYAPLMVTFTAEVTGETPDAPLSYLWRFGDGYQSDEQKPTHTYQTPGQFRPTLTITNQCGSVTATTTVRVDNADFTWEPVANQSFQYQFTDISDGDAGSWVWVFGTKKQYSEEQNPVYTFPQPGIYAVTMTVIRPGTSRTVLHEIPVTNPRIP